MVGLIGMTLASADPGAMRVGAGEKSAMVVSRSVTSARMPVEGDLEVAVWADTGGQASTLSAMGIAIGQTTRHVGRRSVVGWDLGWSAGPTFPLQAPALALSVSPYARRWRSVGAGELGVAVVAPAAVQLLGGLAARLPVQAELTAAGPVGPVQLGVQASGGVVLSPGWSGFALDGQLGVVVLF
ncbi:MAG: hypothetical protein P8R54_02650 [Myxococcota bacterium]|nr:hypothetical protein [Myxococcota bacterium]